MSNENYLLLNENDDDDDDGEIAKDAKDLFSSSLYYISCGEWTNARAAAAEARDLFDELHFVKESAEVRLIMGFIDYELGDFKAALPMLASAQQQFSSVGCKDQQFATLYLLAYCHLGLEKPSKAIYTLKLAQNIIKANPQILESENSLNSFLPDLKKVSDSINSMLEDLLNKYPEN